MKVFDTPEDYTYYHSEEENRRDCVDIVYVSHFLKGQCISYGVPYYETSHDRETVLNAFVAELKAK